MSCKVSVRTDSFSNVYKHGLFKKERKIYELKYYRDEWPLKCLFLIAIQSFLH